MPVPGDIPPSYLFQFDLSFGEDMFKTGYYDTIAVDTSGSYHGGIHLGTDGRIYVSRAPHGSAALSVIVNPKRQGTEYFNGVAYGTYGHAVEIKNYQQISENIASHALFSIYSNPGNGNINLVFKKDVKEAVISVRNIFGQQVWGPVKFDGLVENEEIGFDLGHLPEGIYFIEILNEEHEAYFVKYQMIK